MLSEVPLVEVEGLHLAGATKVWQEHGALLATASCRHARGDAASPLTQPKAESTGKGSLGMGNLSFFSSSYVFLK